MKAASIRIPQILSIIAKQDQVDPIDMVDLYDELFQYVYSQLNDYFVPLLLPNISTTREQLINKEAYKSVEKLEQMCIDYDIPLPKLILINDVMEDWHY